MNDTKAKTIKISVKDESSKPIERVVKQFSKLDKSMKKTAKTGQALQAGFGRLRTMFGGFIAALGVREITRSIDSFQLLKDRITALWGETQNTEETFRKLIKVANDTNSPIDTIVDGFARISISTKDMGISVDNTIRGVKSLQQTLRLSGSNVQEANSVFLQFSQSMGLSRIQGQELRAIMLGNATMAKLLAIEFETTKGKLRELGERGELVAGRAFQMLIDKGKELDEQASLLRVTFGQAATKVMNAFRTELDKLNTAFESTTKGAKVAKFLMDNMKGILAVATAIISAGVFYKIAAGVAFLTKAVLSLTLATGGAGVALAGLGAAVSYFIFKERKVLTTTERIAKKEKERLKLLKLINAERAPSKTGDYKGVEFRQTADSKASVALNRKKIAQLDKEILLEQRHADLKAKRAFNQTEQGKAELATYAKLNKAYRKGALNLSQYTEKLKEQEAVAIHKKYQLNKSSVLDYNNSLAALEKKYDDILRKTLELQAINDNPIFEGIRQGAESTLKSIGTVAEQISSVTTKAFGHLEDNLVDFVKTGKINFRDFTQAIMDDITRMVIRMSIIKPLAGGLSDYFSGGTGAAAGTSGGKNARGNAFFGGNVIPFASGGVVGSPTTFGMSGGRTGLMGEAGPEAIIPLSRGSNGKLGITGSGTVVNVINNSDSSETETKRSKGSDGSEQIDVYIVNKVSEAIGGGQFDRPFQQTYGLNRRGQ